MTLLFTIFIFVLVFFVVSLSQIIRNIYLIMADCNILIVILVSSINASFIYFAWYSIILI